MTQQERFSKDFQIANFMKIHSVWAELWRTDSCVMGTDRQTVGLWGRTDWQLCYADGQTDSCVMRTDRLTVLLCGRTYWQLCYADGQTDSFVMRTDRQTVVSCGRTDRQQFPNVLTAPINKLWTNWMPPTIRSRIFRLPICQQKM
jgi:hypothetical protein